MTDPSRTVPRWLHVWAVATLVATFFLLALGQLVTSFAAGMADPLWPTEPWYVFSTATPAEKDRFRGESAYFLEHSHRIFAYTVGGLMGVLALGLAVTEPRRRARWVVFGGLLVLIAGFAGFHYEMIAQNKLIVAGTLSRADIRVPLPGVSVALIGLAVALAVGVSGLHTRGGTLRLLGTLVLVAVMIQGLLGGVRVLLNELIGPDLAKIHGIFAQVVFGLLTAVAMLSVRTTAPDRDGPESRKFARWSAILAALIFVQVVFGAFVRHDPTPLTQRLHMLTAFVAAALAVWFLHAAFATPDVRTRVSAFGWALSALLVLQVYLGVEAWLAKFGGGLFAEVKLTPHYITIRTLHALVGSGLWAVALALALRLRKPANASSNTLEPNVSGRANAGAQAPVRTPEVAVSHLRGDAR